MCDNNIRKKETEESPFYQIDTLSFYKQQKKVKGPVKVPDAFSSTLKKKISW
jgi:hypothetical protein